MNLSRHFDTTDTIIALITPAGKGAVAVLRVSGTNAVSVTNLFFKGKNLEKQNTHTVHFGSLVASDEVIDEVLITLFFAPKSYTGENVVEISCHGSPYIIKKIIELYLSQGVRYAQAGEFTRRAFLNGKLDLAQAEAVADLIASETALSHRAALNQMRGGFSAEIRILREKLVHFASLIELELDFAEEDVEFADRKDLKKLVTELQTVIADLVASFKIGNVIKNGIPTVIAGKPNAGKSTLLNALLNEEKAIVSEIAGTTRDFIEDELIIEGISFRFIDTAGLRDDTADKIEAIGVARTKVKMQEASLIIYLFDLTNTTATELGEEVNKLENLGKPFLLVGNKTDQATSSSFELFRHFENIVFISADKKEGLENLKNKLLEAINVADFSVGNTIVTNARHYENLTACYAALTDVMNGLENNLTGDFLALDIRQSLHFLGEITGEITTDDLLANIFSKFCIGK
jgi:tRNA modification GTPase